MLLNGVITKRDSGFYYVMYEGIIYECRLKGNALKGKFIYSGDNVCFSIEDKVLHKGMVHNLGNRKNLLLRPKVANVDNLFIIMTLFEPMIDKSLLDRIILYGRLVNSKIYLVINKMDEAEEKDLDNLRLEYKNSGIEIIPVSAKTKEGISYLCTKLDKNMNVFLGPSGVGKSSILNAIIPDLHLSVGVLSQKMKRGKHTTRQITFYPYESGYICDSPGFSRIELPENLKWDELQSLYEEFVIFDDGCKFRPCTHYKENKCGVKDALGRGDIDPQRYERYIYMLEELKLNEERRYK